MTHFRKFGFSVALASFLFGCSGVDNGDLFPDDEAGAPDGGDELGSVEQAIQGKTTTTYQFGTQTGSSRQRCNKTSSGQVCEVPNTLTLKVCTTPRVGSALGGTAQTAGNEAVNELNGIANFAFNFPGASLGVLDGLCDLTDNQPENGGGTDANIMVSKGSTGTGTASNQVKDYVNVSYILGNATSNLAEAAGVVGQYKSHQMCSIVVDVDRLQAKGTDATQDHNLVFHAVASALLNCAGMGFDPLASATGGRYLRPNLNGAIDVAQLSTGEFCQANAYLTAPAGTYANGTACSADLRYSGSFSGSGCARIARMASRFWRIAFSSSGGGSENSASSVGERRSLSSTRDWMLMASRGPPTGTCAPQRVGAHRSSHHAVAFQPSKRPLQTCSRASFSSSVEASE